MRKVNPFRLLTANAPLNPSAPRGVLLSGDAMDALVGSYPDRLVSLDA